MGAQIQTAPFFWERQLWTLQPASRFKEFGQLTEHLTFVRAATPRHERVPTSTQHGRAAAARCPTEALPTDKAWGRDTRHPCAFRRDRGLRRGAKVDDEQASRARRAGEHGTAAPRAGWSRTEPARSRTAARVSEGPQLRASRLAGTAPVPQGPRSSRGLWDRRRQTRARTSGGSLSSLPPGPCPASMAGRGQSEPGRAAPGERGPEVPWRPSARRSGWPGSGCGAPRRRRGAEPGAGQGLEAAGLGRAVGFGSSVRTSCLRPAVPLRKQEGRTGEPRVAVAVRCLCLLRCFLVIIIFFPLDVTAGCGRCGRLASAGGTQSINFNREHFLPVPYLVSCLLKECHPLINVNRHSFSSGESCRGNRYVAVLLFTVSVFTLLVPGSSLGCLQGSPLFKRSPKRSLAGSCLSLVVRMVLEHV